VSFSQNHEVMGISKVTMSYTHDDINQFIQAAIGDALRLRTTPVIEMEEDVLYECVGLENLLSRNVARWVATNKRRHANLILQGQWYYNKEELAKLGRMSSSWARDRAQMRAAPCK
jgi:hypothetical protein